uniref:Zinc finger protein 541 n=1 Tax=Coturnix japonica TaxID=93934 RepID=A0A8C2ST93_COTJA
PAALAGKEKEALQLLAEADKKVRGSQSFFAGLFGGSSRIEEACDIYARAANMFKMAKNWSAAGNAFCQAAQLHLQLQSKHDAATNFVDAGNAFKKADPQEAINCLIRAIEIYTDMGRFTIAAKHHISIAEIYEGELVDIDKVSGPSHHNTGVPCCWDLPGPSQHTRPINALLKVATYAAQAGSECLSGRPWRSYEQVGGMWGDWGPLCPQGWAGGDFVGGGSCCHVDPRWFPPAVAVQKYEEMFPAFTDSRECKLLKKLLDAHEEQNVARSLTPTICWSRVRPTLKHPPPNRNIWGSLAPFDTTSPLPHRCSPTSPLGMSPKGEGVSRLHLPPDQC